jgi:hypothetical protein
VRFSISTFGREQDESGESGDDAAGDQCDASAPPAPAPILGDAALHAREQIGRGVDALGAGVERIAEAVFERAHR